MYKYIFILLLLIVGCKQKNNEYSFDSDIHDYASMQEEMDFWDNLADNNPLRNKEYEVKKIIIHCTASQDNKPLSLEKINQIFKERGFTRPGYHGIINPDGSVIWTAKLKPRTMRQEDFRWGCEGQNAWSIHLSYSGGFTGKDGRTKEQKDKLIKILKNLKLNYYPSAEILGHFQIPGVKKTCPNFDAKTEYANILSK